MTVRGTHGATQIWIAVSVYVLVAIIKKRLAIGWIGRMTRHVRTASLRSIPVTPGCRVSLCWVAYFSSQLFPLTLRTYFIVLSNLNWRTWNVRY